MPQQHKKMLEQTENVAYNTSISLKFFWQWNASENQNFTVSSIPLCNSCYADNDDKGNTNIHGLRSTWQALSHTTAGRTSLLCEVWEIMRFYYHLSRSWKYQDLFVKTKTKTFSSRPRLLFQDHDHFSCPRSTSRPRPRSRDYIPG